MNKRDEMINRVIAMGSDSPGMFGGDSLMHVMHQGGFLLQQHPVEYAEFLLFLQEQGNIRRVCEIGSAAGGNIAALWDVLGPLEQTLIVEINMHHHAHLRGEVCQKVLPRVEIIGDSHDPKVRDMALSIAPEVDLLFIDGDHSLRGVQQDFEWYSPMVAVGGFVGFHDTMGLHIPECAEGVRLITERYADTFELALQSHHLHGITVLRRISK